MTATVDSFTDLPPPLRSAAEAHGREMVALVYNSGVATEAVKRLAQSASGEQRQAIQMIAWAFNETSSALARAKGWGAVELAECEQAVEMGFAQAPAIVGSDGRVL